jgi:phage-related protein
MSNPRQWTIEYYEDVRGARPAREFIDRLPLRDRAKVDRALAVLAQLGINLRYPLTRHVQGPIWELRPGATRLFCFVVVQRRIIILHGYRKKSRAAPQKEIDTAWQRYQDYQRRTP